MVSLRRLCTPIEAYEAGKFLLNSPLARHLARLPDFPTKPQKSQSSIFLSPAPLLNEIAFQKVRIEGNVDKIVDFFHHVAKLNEAVFSKKPSLVAEYINKIRDRFGYSLFMLNKVISIKYLYYEDGDVQSAVQSYLVLYNNPRRDIIAVILEDFVDPTRSYAVTRHTVHRYIRQNRFGDMVERVLTSQLCPPVGSKEEASGALQAYGMHSVIDAQFFLWTRRPYLNGLIASGDRRLLDEAIVPIVADAISSSAIGFEPSLFEEPGDAAPFNEFTLLRHSGGWLEYEKVRSHRYAVERALGHRLDGADVLRSFPVNIDETVIRQATLHELWDGAYNGSLNLAEIDPATGGHLHRVVGLMQIIDDGQRVFDFDGACLLSLLNKTLDVAILTRASELSSFLSVRRDDKLYQYLKAALINDCEETAIAGHVLRKTTQAVIMERFDSIVDFMKFLYSSGKHVGDHFYATCNETFLVQLYQLFATANDVVEARAQLLEAYGTIAEDQEAIDRAKSLRLELKLSKVRDDIDDNRIYIDPLRFHQWLMEKLGDDLRAAIPILTEWSQKITTGEDLNNPITLLQNPELRIAKVLDTAYHEFCTNKFFGVDSYIGRRIRHGTLKGVMISEVKSILEEATATLRSTELAGFFAGWFAQYEKAISQIGGEILQLHSESKNRGGIVATIGTSGKIQTARLAVRDTVLALEQENPVQKALATIQEYCWRLLETDLLRIRADIERIRSESLLIDPTALPAGEGSRAHVTDLVRKLNECVQRKFTTLTLWLTQPKNVSPSATLSLLFNAVLVEVKEQIPGFNPRISVAEESSLDLYGHRYHYVYDLLYVLVYNAGKHGKNNGVISFDVNMIRAANSVQITIGSDLRDDEYQCDVERKVQAAMDAEIENAFKVDVFSGIRKVRSLAAHLEEFKQFDVSYSQRRIYFSATLAITPL
jgi:hypothetical protein